VQDGDGPPDAGGGVTLQSAAFLTEARLYRSTELPPLVETVEDVRRELEGTTSLGALLAGRLVGSVRLTATGTIGWISRVAVAPDQQGRGIGSALLASIEAAAPPGVQRFQLAAGEKSQSNIAMYEHRGYVSFSRSIDTTGIELVLMGKDRW
jgi:GNAT superfamily N-acetyltransferase